MGELAILLCATSMAKYVELNSSIDATCVRLTFFNTPISFCVLLISLTDITCQIFVFWFNETPPPNKLVETPRVAWLAWLRIDAVA